LSSAKVGRCPLAKRQRGWDIVRVVAVLLTAAKSLRVMYILFGILTVLFIILGFVGFIGGIPLLVFWSLAIICALAMVKTYPRRAKGPYRESNRPE
jgi:hypothetical protein